MQSLQINEWLNIGSCVISAISVLYGFSDFFVMMTHSREKVEINEIPFKKSILSLLSITVDTALRTLTIAYLMTFFKVYIVLLPLAYLILMVTIVYIRNKSCNCNSLGGIALYTVLSFGCSAFEVMWDKDAKDVDIENYDEICAIFKPDSV